MSTEIQGTTVRWHGNGKTNGAHGERSGVIVHRMDIETTKRVEIRDLTTLVQEVVRNAEVEAGLVTLPYPCEPMIN